MEKIWLKEYPEGIPFEINPDEYQSIRDIFEESCSKYGQSPAFYNFGTTLTYQQLDAHSLALAAYLQQILHLKKGDRIALMMPNILQYPVALYAALRIGLAVVNINPLYTVPELVYQLNDAGAETIVVLSNFAETVQKALPNTSLKHVIVTDLGDFFPRAKAWFFYFYLKYLKKKIPKYHIPQMVPFKKTLSQGKNLTLKKVVINHEDIAFLQYTGGTTGIAKGAVLTQRNIIANILQAEAWFGQVFRSNQEAMITALPLYHIFSLMANCLFISKMGGLNILITNPRDISAFISELKKIKFTAITAVNTLFHALLCHPKFAKLDFSQLKISLGGGMSVQRAVAEKWHAITGKPIVEAYGLTETSPCVTINPPEIEAYNGTIGLPVSSTEVCILDDAGHEVPLGQPGELAIKGPQVMSGYWRNPQETQKVFTKEGWLLTGDIASMNERGYVKLLERKKDMILVSGFNVYPNEIEDVLMRMSKIQEAAVIGVPDKNSGEASKAFIVKKDPGLTASDVLLFCRENLTGYKIPKYIEFCKDLPKTNVGKISRRELREMSATQAS